MILNESTGLLFLDLNLGNPAISPFVFGFTDFDSVLAALVVALQSQFLAANPKAQLVSESVCLAGVNNISSMLKLEEMVNNLFKQFEPLLEQIPQE